LTDKAIDYIKEADSNNEPFFMYLSYTAPHHPMHAKESDLARVQHVPIKSGKKGDWRRIYCAMVQNMDDNIGRVLATLDELKIEENTLVVFLSDNGGPKEHNGSNNYPLKGKKGNLWEGGIRVPFGVSWKGKIPAGQVSDTPVISLDLLPTFAAISGADQLGEIKTDGINLMPLLTRQVNDLDERTFFWRRGGKKQAGLRDGKYKYYKTRGNGNEYLFEIGNDLSENNNLIDQYPEVADRMRKRYLKWESTLPELKIGLGAPASKEGENSEKH
ncbi:MAG TPA: sulfatase-like hydrolase/transferase, partial [Pontiella sp.]